jgi:hypothetical protein
VFPLTGTGLAFPFRLDLTDAPTGTLYHAGLFQSEAIMVRSPLRKTLRWKAAVPYKVDLGR